MERNKLISAIWAISGNIGMSKEGTYNVILCETGKKRMRECSDEQLERVVKALKYRGYIEEARRGKATDGQINYIKILESEIGWSKKPKRLRGLMKKDYGVEEIKWLTVKQASNLIECLKEMKERKEERV